MEAGVLGQDGQPVLLPVGLGLKGGPEHVPIQHHPMVELIVLAKNQNDKNVQLVNLALEVSQNLIVPIFKRFNIFVSIAEVIQSI